MAEWTWALVTHGRRAFYAVPLEVAPDHLPGDLWILSLLGVPIHAIANSYNFYDQSFSIVLKVIAIINEILAVGLGILTIGSALVDRPRAIAVAAIRDQPGRDCQLSPACGDSGIRYRWRVF